MIQLKQLKKLKTTGSTVVNCENNIVAISENKKEQPKEEPAKKSEPVVDTKQPAVEVKSEEAAPAQTEEKVEPAPQNTIQEASDDELDAWLNQ